MVRPAFAAFALKPLDAYGRLLAFGIGFGVLFLAFGDCIKRQWDFPVYYLATRALWNGDNPYEPARLSALAQTVEGAGYGGLPYLYPPYLARILTPLALLPFFPAAFAWLAIKCAALEATIFLALFLARIRIHPVSLAVCHFAAIYYRPIALDFNAGNIAILESALILGALAAWRRARTGTASLLFALGGTLKGSSLLLALYPLHLRDKTFLRALAAAFLGLSLVFLLDYKATGEMIHFYRGPQWQALWDEQVQSFYNCSSTTVILRTFSDTYFAEPLLRSPLLTNILVPLFPLWVFAAMAYAIHNRQKRAEFDPCDGRILALLLLGTLLIPPRLAGYTLAWTFFPLVQILWAAYRESRTGSLLLALIGLVLIQLNWPPNHIPPGITQLFIDKDFFGLLCLFGSAFFLCREPDREFLP
ncbi:MAG: glycosyltransferase family 87 protein [bacterium]